MNMFCKRCGKPLLNNGKCIHCGYQQKSMEKNDLIGDASAGVMTDEVDSSNQENSSINEMAPFVNTDANIRKYGRIGFGISIVSLVCRFVLPIILSLFNDFAYGFVSGLVYNLINAGILAAIILSSMGVARPFDKKDKRFAVVGLIIGLIEIIYILLFFYISFY